MSGDMYDYDIADELIGGLDSTGRGRSGSDDAHTRTRAGGGKRRGSSGSARDRGSSIGSDRSTSKLATIRDQIRARTSTTAAGAPRLSVEERVAARLAALHTHREANITGATAPSAASVAPIEADRTAEPAASPVESADVSAASVATTDTQRTRAGARGAPGVAKRAHAAPPPRARAATGVRSPLSPSDRADSSSSLDISAADFTVGTIAARHLAAKRGLASTSASVSVASILEDAVVDESLEVPASIAKPVVAAPSASEDYDDDFVSDEPPVAAPAVSGTVPSEGSAAPVYVASSAPPRAQAEAPAAPRDSARLSFAELAAMFKTPVTTPPAPPADRVHAPSSQATASTDGSAVGPEDCAPKDAAFSDVVAAAPQFSQYTPLDHGSSKLADEPTGSMTRPSETAEQSGPSAQSPLSTRAAPAALIDWRSYMRPSSAGSTSRLARQEESAPAASAHTATEPAGGQPDVVTSTQKTVPEAPLAPGAVDSVEAGTQAPVSITHQLVPGNQQMLSMAGAPAPAVQPATLPAPPLPPGYAHVIYAVPASAIAATLQGALPPPLPGSAPGMTSVPEPGRKRASGKRRSASPRDKRRQAAHDTATAALAIALRAAASAALAKSLRPADDTHPPARSTIAEHGSTAPSPAPADEDHRRGVTVQSRAVRPRELTEDAVARAAAHVGISPAAFAENMTPPRQRKAGDISVSRRKQATQPHATSPGRAAHSLDSVQRAPPAEGVVPEDLPASRSLRGDAAPPPRSMEPTAEMAAVSAAIAEAVAGKICAEQEVTRLRHEIEVLRVAAVSTDTRMPTSRDAGVERSASPFRNHRTLSDTAADTTDDAARVAARSPRSSRSAALHSGAAERAASASAGREPREPSSPTMAGIPAGVSHESTQQQATACVPEEAAQSAVAHSAGGSEPAPAHATLLDALASLAVTPPEGAAPITTAAALAAAHGAARKSGKSETSSVFVHHPALAMQACKQYGLQVYVPYSAIEALQREIDMQDRMIEAYQADNESLRKRTSTGSTSAPAHSTAETAEGDTGARPRIKPSFERTPGELWSFEQPTQTHRTTEGAVRTAAGAELRTALSRETEIQQLREDLEAVRASSRVRENELKAELDAARKAKADMECRLAGVDIPAVRAFAVEENESIRQLRVQVAEQRSRYEGELSQLRTKLAWYIDNQAIIDADAATIAAQADTIRDLQARLTRSRARPEGGAEMTHASAAEPTERDRSLLRAEAKIKELHAQVEQLREALRKKNPDSLVNLIHEAKGASGAVGEQAALLAELRAMRNKSVETEAAHERRLRALRQEFERIKAEHIRREAELQERVRGLEKELQETKKGPDIRRAAQPAAGEHKREDALRGRVAELEGELKHVREFYQQKLKGAGESSRPGRPPIAGTGVRGHGVNATALSARSRGRGASVRGAVAPAATRANTTVSTSDHPSALHSISTIQVLDVSAACTEPGEEQLLPAAPALEREPAASARRGGSSASASPARGGRVEKGNVESIDGGANTDPRLITLQEECETLRRHLHELKAERDDLQGKLQRTEAEAKRIAQESTSTALAESKVPADHEGEPKHVDKRDGPVAALVSLAASRQLGLQAQVDALYGALQVLESRAEARELELLRAERVVSHAHTAAETSLREHYEAIIRMKDQALEACKHEIVHLVAEVNELRAA